MAMNLVLQKSLKTSRNYTYTYYTSPADAGKPTILLLHGFPDHAMEWKDLAANYFIPSGYGVVIPDCLGYDGTDKPTDPHAYVLSKQSQDICEILDAEGLDKIVTAGHDFGSTFAQRMYIWHPERCIGMITLNVAYRGKPTGPMNLDLAKPMFVKQLGYFPMEYWYLLSNPLDGPKILDNHTSSFYDICHAADPKLWPDVLCQPDGLESWLLSDRTCDVQDYAKVPGAKQAFLNRMARDGFTAPTCWYRAAVEGHQFEVEQTLPEDRFIVNVPYLFIAGLGDVACLPSAIEQARMAGLLPKLTVVELDATHWSVLAKPAEVGQACIRWLEEKYG
jgi:pimeloyl-ACP methyl ester carboxylesterase